MISFLTVLPTYWLFSQSNQVTLRREKWAEIFPWLGSTICLTLAWKIWFLLLLLCQQLPILSLCFCCQSRIICLLVCVNKAKIAKPAKLDGCVCGLCLLGSRNFYWLWLLTISLPAARALVDAWSCAVADNIECCIWLLGLLELLVVVAALLPTRRALERLTGLYFRMKVEVLVHVLVRLRLPGICNEIFPLIYFWLWNL